MTTTTEASEALARLREVVKPGKVLGVIERRSRSGDTCEVLLYPGLGRAADFFCDVAAVLGLSTRPWAGGGIVVSGDYVLSDLLDRLSVALFGGPGQIKGEYL